MSIYLLKTMWQVIVNVAYIMSRTAARTSTTITKKEIYEGVKKMYGAYTRYCQVFRYSFIQSVRHLEITSVTDKQLKRTIASEVDQGDGEEKREEKHIIGARFL